MGKRFSNTACRFGIVSVGCKFILHISIARKSSHYDAVFQRRVQHKHITWLTYSSSVFRPRDWTDAAVNQKVLHEPFTTPLSGKFTTVSTERKPRFLFLSTITKLCVRIGIFLFPVYGINTSLVKKKWKN